MPFKIPQGDAKSEFVQNSFTRIASRYDLFNDLITQGMHRYWKGFLVNQSQLNEGDTVLDLCCGTGDITERLYKKVGRKGITLGLDFSNGMLQVAVSRNKKHSQHQFVQGDAMVLPIKSESIDVVTVGYGLRNLVSINNCLLEVFRILKPGGRFLILDMGKVKKPLLKSIFRFYFFRVVPKIGRILYHGEKMFDYFPESSVNYPDQEGMSKMLSTAGFEKVLYFDFYFGANAVHRGIKP
ncbi:MAG: bifunctional demethylmenaquinone methyltransferase/2-methoxy-6-polyprenyl-1,4-benzoquinol methylase UbiE [Proteobacteria bacterium]|nr:bifunctional demethylmenaquinone methyltransferase/2-methoxy-6-polyprenyl-1,4-benzoquinol methylase UbiE [Pseudomonadota bacterium]